ncbi:MAG: hypothetical protein MPEBLZ_04348, partial [Candidatus Methanoperedens nitroreducens]
MEELAGINAPARQKISVDGLSPWKLFSSSQKGQGTHTGPDDAPMG